MAGGIFSLTNSLWLRPYLILPNTAWGIAMDSDKEKNKMIMEQIFFHLLETLRLCTQLDLSGLGPLGQQEWNDKIKLCKNALEFTKNSVEKLSKLISPEGPSYS